VLALALIVSGCGTGSDLGSAGPTQAAQNVAGGGSGKTLHVVMKSLDFSPTALNAGVGDEVVWTNEDEAPHNVTYVSGPRFSSSRPMMAIGKRFSLRLSQPGTIHYYCTIHPWMKATITVAP
jgi:plastocyanin